MSVWRDSVTWWRQLLRWRGRLGNRRRRGRDGKIALGAARTGRSRRTVIELRRQRVWTETELHQRFGFRQTCRGKPVVRLIAQHGSVSARVPLAIRFPVKVALTNQSLLNFLCAFRLQVKTSQTLAAVERAPSPVSRMPAARGRALMLGNVSGVAIRCPFRGRHRGCVRRGISRGNMRSARMRSCSWLGGRMCRGCGGSCLLRCRGGGSGAG